MSHNKVKNMSTRQNILNSAGAVLARNPGAAMADIAQKAGVGRATLYRFFPTRDDLIQALALESLRRADEATSHIPVDSLSAENVLAEIFEAVVPLGDRFRFLSSEPAALNDPEIEAATNRQRDELAELVEAMKNEGSLDRAVPTAWVVTAIDALFYAAWEAVDDGSVARRDAAALAFRTIVRGLGSADTPSTGGRKNRPAKG